MHPTALSSGQPQSSAPQAVQVFDQGGKVSAKVAGILCPTCRGPLRIGVVAGSQFAGCAACHGMLFQREVFARLVQHLRATTPDPKKRPQPMNPDELHVRRSCPTCNHTLETHPYGGPGNSVVDTCFACGIIWFDQGELTKLIEAPGPR